MTTEIKGKSIRKCSNCHKANPFSKDYCPIRTEEIELYLSEHPDPSDIYGMAKMKAQNHVGDIIREEGFCPFDSRYIETPLSILNGICLHELEYSKRGMHKKEDIGKFVKCRVCADGKTYLGIYLGEFPQTISLSYQKDDQTMDVEPGFYNPAMWVMQLNRIVWGSESYWGIIEKPEDLKAMFLRMFQQEMEKLTNLGVIK
jgi:hypothetical protein